MSSPPDVYGAGEAAGVIGVGEARFRVLARREDFPTPTVLSIGRVWDGPSVREWTERYNAELRRLPKRLRGGRRTAQS